MIAAEIAPASLVVLTLTYLMATMLHLPKFVYALVEEKQVRLYHAMRLQGLRMSAYWLSGV